MSPLFSLIYISKDASLRRCYDQRYTDDDISIANFSRLLASTNKGDATATALEKGIHLEWEDVYDFVNPFGDSRGNAFDSVWLFDLQNDILFLLKETGLSSASLNLCRSGELTSTDFEPFEQSKPTLCSEVCLSGPRWVPELRLCPRKQAFLNRLLRDFGHTWRHLFRRQMNHLTFMKLAYATIWISTMQFDILERMGFEHVSRGGPYVSVRDLPKWQTPEEVLIQVGSTWVVFSQDSREGLELVRNHVDHASIDSGHGTCIYIILTLRQIFLCRKQGQGIEVTRSEALFNGDIPPSDAALDMIIWATNLEHSQPLRKLLDPLPVEIQDNILYYTTVSPVASAKLGCELGLGLPFAWLDQGLEICLETNRRHRSERSPVESQLFFDGIMSGLSYKREFKSKVSQSPPTLSLRRTILQGGLH